MNRFWLSLKGMVLATHQESSSGSLHMKHLWSGNNFLFKICPRSQSAFTPIPKQSFARPGSTSAQKKNHGFRVGSWCGWSRKYNRIIKTDIKDYIRVGMKNIYRPPPTRPSKKEGLGNGIFLKSKLYIFLSLMQCQTMVLIVAKNFPEINRIWRLIRWNQMPLTNRNPWFIPYVRTLFWYTI